MIDDHQRERITTWRLAYNGECAQDPEDRARAAACALAQFDAAFPAPSAAAPVEPVAKRVELYDAGYDEGYKWGLRDGGEIAEPELASLRQKARYWDAVASGKVRLYSSVTGAMPGGDGYWCGYGDVTDHLSPTTPVFTTAAEAVEAAIAAGALK